MANQTIGTAYIQIEPTTQGISGSISNLLDGEATSAGQSAGKSFSGAFGSAAKIAVGSMAALGTAGVALGKALYSTASQTAQVGDNIDKMSQKLGVSSTFYQEWDAVLQHSGSSMDAQSATFKKLANAAQDASKDQEAAFKALGLSMDAVKSMSTEDLFTAVITGLQGMEEGTERTALATDLLGKGATELGPLFNTTAEDTQGMIDTVHELGGVMDETAVKNAAAFQDSLQDLQTAFAGIKNKAMSELIPSFTGIMNGLAGLVTGSETAKDELKTGFTSLANNITETIPGIVSGITEMIDVLAEIAPDLMTTLVNAIIENLPQLVVAAAKIILALAEALIKALPSLIQAIPQIMDGLKNAFIQYTAPLKDVGASFVNTIKESLENKWNDIIIKASSLVADLKNKFISKVSEFKSIGSDIVAGIKNGIFEAWDSLIRSVSDLAGSLVDGIKSVLKIGSPSKIFADEVGKWIPAGISVGIEDNIGTIDNAMDDVYDATTSQNAYMREAYTSADVSNNGENVSDILSRYLPMLENIGNTNVTLEGDASALFRAVRKQNSQFKRSTGQSAFV